MDANLAALSENTAICQQKRENKVRVCHARKWQILSYLNIPKTTSMSFMYEANYGD